MRYKRGMEVDINSGERKLRPWASGWMRYLDRGLLVDEDARVRTLG